MQKKYDAMPLTKTKIDRTKILHRRLIELLKLNKSADVHLVFTSVKGNHFNNLNNSLVHIYSGVRQQISTFGSIRVI